MNIHRLIDSRLFRDIFAAQRTALAGRFNRTSSPGEDDCLGRNKRVGFVKDEFGTKKLRRALCDLYLVVSTEHTFVFEPI